MTRIYAGVASLAVVALLGGTWWAIQSAQTNDPFAECRAGAIGGGAIGGPLSLVNGDGATVTDAEIFAKPTLLYFGYTFCPDVCPMDNARNAEAVDILEEKGFDVQPAFISIDPARDTPEVVKDFAANLHPKMIGLTGSEDQVKAASQAYKTYFKKQEATDEFYLVDHSTFTYLVLPKIGFVDFFKREDSAEDMANRTACFVEKANP
ncbi:MAG: SCO family protein [Pseudorhodobacter sp.]|nr:MAG: SCO family protein [Pseudorhodobacter sp.]